MKLLVMMQVLLCCFFVIASEPNQDSVLPMLILVGSTVLAVSIAYFRCNGATLLVVTLVLEVSAAVWFAFLGMALFREGNEMEFTAPLGVYISNIPIFFWLIPVAVAFKLCVMLGSMRSNDNLPH